MNIISSLAGGLEAGMHKTARNVLHGLTWEGSFGVLSPQADGGIFPLNGF